MKVITETFSISTPGNSTLVDITKSVEEMLFKIGLSEGQVTIFIPGATAGITTIEYEPGLLQDFPEALERIAPSHISYHHDATWQDGNGHAHVRASMIGPSLSVPFQNRQLLLGTWQQIVVVDCDIRPRKRRVIVQFIGQ